MAPRDASAVTEVVRTGSLAARPVGYRQRWRHLDKSVFLWLVLIAVLEAHEEEPRQRVDHQHQKNADE